MEIVGAIARSPEKVGKDLGDLTGLGRELGVTVSDDAAAVFQQTRPDIAVIAVNSYLTDAVEQLRICAEHGVNAVTLSEEMLYPGTPHLNWPPNWTRWPSPPGRR